MKRPFLTISLTALVLFVTLSSFIFDINGLVNDVLDQTNRFRRSKGMAALQMNEDLNDIARKHSENMAKGRVGFGHDGFNQREKEAKKKINGMHAFAENVLYGANTGKEAVNLWKGSPGHRRNMLGHYKYIGIGTAKDRQGRIYYTQVFAD